MHTIRVWDLPTRLFHWALVCCVIGLVVTANLGGNWMAWHFRLGFSVLTLLLFRLIWGLVGGHWSRFSSFLYAPSTLFRYLRGQGDPAHSVGHSPVGALSVFAMLVVLLAQVGTGLISDDEIASSGPLVQLVSGHVTSLATSYHKNVGKFFVLGLVVLHLVAIGFYRWIRKEKLVRAMVVGDKSLPHSSVPSARDTAATRLLALGLLLACGLFVRWLVALGDVAGF